MRIEEQLLFAVYVICFIGVIAVVGLLGVSVIDKAKEEAEPQKEIIKDYQSFKKDTEIINGTVQKAEKENHIILPDSYNLVVKSKDDSKLLSVNSKEYRNYQVGSKAHFRIDKTDNNSIVRDLKNKDDIDNLKKYKEYRKHNTKFH